LFSEVETRVFFDELAEKIQCLSDNILILERDGGSQQAIQEIFRAAHTIKGSSAVMGFEKIASLTHEMENVFQEMRSGKLSVSKALIDILLQSIDALIALEEEAKGGELQVNIDFLVEKIKLFYTEETTASPAQTLSDKVPQRIEIGDIEEDVIREAAIKGYNAYWVSVGIDPGCQMKSVRAFMVFEELKRLGEIIKCVPSAEDIQEGCFKAGFELIIISGEETGQINKLVSNVAEVSSVVVEPVQVNGIGEKAAKKKGASGAEKVELSDRKVAQTIRIDVQKLDILMNLVGELVIDRTRLDRFAEVFTGRFGSSDLIDNLNEISVHLGQVAGDLQEQVMKARMLPVAYLFNRFPRMVRDLSQKLGKEVDIIIEGQETELDRNLIEVIGDPLIHLIRNAIDHGIEDPEERVKAGKPRTGTIILKASYREGQIIITIQDDGKGMDPRYLRNLAVEKGVLSEEEAGRLSDREALELVFRPGFSTVAAVSDLSGRGVGMDIVRSQIEQINGMVELETTPGQGCTVIIMLPLTLAIIRALMITLRDQIYAVPLTNVLEIIKSAEIKRIKNSEVIIVRGQVLSLIRLTEFFGRPVLPGDDGYVIILGIGDKKLGIMVDNVLGEQEVVIKSLGEYLGRVAGLSGATILGDGRVALIIDVRSLIKEFGLEDSVYAAS